MSFISIIERVIEMVNVLPEYKLDIVSAFIQFLLSDVGNNYEEDLRHSIKQADKGRIIKQWKN